ncbi:MAG: phage tail tube protein [Desulfuromonadaceae bacterium]|nr:phage tail tube protein [Desulfuromonadaceae bacterium]
MGQVTGSNCRLVYDAETVFGTTPTTPAAIVAYFKDEGFAQDIEQITSNIIRGNRNPTTPFTGNRSVKGSMSSELAPYGQALLLKHLLGSVETAGDTAPYTHVFKIAKLPTSLCFEKQFTDLGKYFLYNGVRVASASFDIKPAGPVDVAFEFAGQKETVSGTPVDAAPTDMGHTPWEGFEAEVQEGGTAIGVITALKFDVNNDIQSDQYAIGGGGTVYGLPEGTAKVSGSATAIFESLDLYTKAVEGTASSIKATLTKGTGVGTKGNESIEFFLPELKFKATTPTIKDAKGLMLELPFEAYYDIGAGASALQITLKSTQETI